MSARINYSEKQYRRCTNGHTCRHPSTQLPTRTNQTQYRLSVAPIVQPMPGRGERVRQKCASRCARTVTSTMGSMTPLYCKLTKHAGEGISTQLGEKKLGQSKTKRTARFANRFGSAAVPVLLSSRNGLPALLYISHVLKFEKKGLFEHDCVRRLL